MATQSSATDHRRLSERAWPDNVTVFDFGIRGFDLTYALLDGHDVTIFVDATPRGNQPGTLYTIEPALAEIENIEAGAMIDAHSMDPMKVLGLVKSMGGTFKKILLVGCEPATLGRKKDSWDSAKRWRPPCRRRLRSLSRWWPKCLVRCLVRRLLKQSMKRRLE